MNGGLIYVTLQCFICMFFKRVSAQQHGTPTIFERTKKFPIKFVSHIFIESIIVFTLMHLKIMWEKIRIRNYFYF